MVKPKSYSLAIEIDRNLKLNLSNGQFDALASFIDGYEDQNRIANNLSNSTTGDILSIISDYRKK
jgi:hypothetical protein